MVAMMAEHLVDMKVVKKALLVYLMVAMTAD